MSSGVEDFLLASMPQKLQVFGVGAPAVGVSPPIGGLLLQLGFVTVATSTGFYTLNFPKAFPNGLIKCTLTIQANTREYQINSSAKTHVVVFFGSATTCGLHWTAIGW